MKTFSIISSFFLILCLAGCDILYPPIKVQFADTTITAPNGSFVLYGTVSQAPLDSATLARLRSEGYTGGTDKAPVIGAEVTATNGDTKLTATTDRLGRYVLVTKNSGTYSLTAKHYAVVTNEPLSVDVRASSQKDIILRPAKEFIFPLAIGNKWVFDYRYNYTSGEVREGIEQWEITEKRTTMNSQTIYRYTYSGSGISYAFNGTQSPYTYKGDTAMVQAINYYILRNPVQYFSPNDTLARFRDNLDTVQIGGYYGTSASLRRYVHGVGLVEAYADGGSPASGRYSVSLKLRSYTFK